MKILSYWCSILMLIGLMAMAQDSNSPPEVTNVVAQQVGQQVEISYDLLDQGGNLMTISSLFSGDSRAYAQSQLNVTALKCGITTFNAANGIISKPKSPLPTRRPEG